MSEKSTSIKYKQTNNCDQWRYRDLCKTNVPPPYIYLSQSGKKEIFSYAVRFEFQNFSGPRRDFFYFYNVDYGVCIRTVSVVTQLLQY